MRRMLISAVTAMALMGGLAGMSGAERLDQNVDALRSQWVAVQALPDGRYKARKIEQMHDTTTRLLARYPNSSRLHHWNSALVREQRRDRHAGRFTG